MKSRLSAALVAAGCALALGVGAAKADSITYAVNLNVGIGTAAGSIQTDGAIGTLSAVNITDWNLVLDLLGDGTATFTLTKANSTVVFLDHPSLTATASALFFNFSNIVPGLPGIVDFVDSGVAALAFCSFEFDCGG